MADEFDDITLDADSNIDDSVVAEESAQETIKKLRLKLKDAESKAKENMDGWQRSQADFVNLRKRDEEAKNDFLKFAGSNIIIQIIPVLDSFALAIAHGDKGSEIIYNQLLKVLKDNGVEETNPIGEQFDPSHHEAIGTIKTDKSEDDHKILEVLQKGYSLNGRVLRPAKVRVGEFA